ncbi:hypothetical protein DPMN_124942 [Dreissena polymorpha]|uniref:Uncharacterized protein n=1 Tax=Dreissena polymorpha TaxID=45954 RepID=A0A9D4JWN8_DREPO|nr:hypothetical protein DPMN_124942 [Dreissena polymorpha]
MDFSSKRTCKNSTYHEETALLVIAEEVVFVAIHLVREGRWFASNLNKERYMLRNSLQNPEKLFS